MSGDKDRHAFKTKTQASMYVRVRTKSTYLKLRCRLIPEMGNSPYIPLQLVSGDFFQNHPTGGFILK